MKHRMILVLVLMILGITGCGSQGESSCIIMNGYEVRKISETSVALGYVEENGSELNIEIGVESYVYQYCNNDRYIGIQQVDEENLDSGESRDTSNPRYYVIDTEGKSVSGALRKEEYEEYLVENKIENMCDWINTDDLQ